MRNKKKKGKTNKPLKITNEKPKWQKYISTKAILIYGIITVLLTMTGFYGEIIRPIYDKVFPEKFYRDNLDNNIRGLFLKATNTIERDSLKFIIGSSITGKVGFRYYANQFYKRNQSYTCFWPNDFIVVLKGNCPLTFRFGNDNRILFSASILGSDFQNILYISDNQFILDDSDLYTWNGDDYGIELIDNNNNNKVLFSADFVPPNEIWIQGIFHENSQYSVGFVNRTVMPIPIEKRYKLKLAKDSIKPIFEYTGKDWKGKRTSKKY